MLCGPKSYDPVLKQNLGRCIEPPIPFDSNVIRSVRPLC